MALTTARILLAAQCLTLASCAWEEEKDFPLYYRVEVTRPADQVFHLTLKLQVVPGAIKLSLPAFTPGGLIEPHSRYLSKFRVSDPQGGPLPFHRLDKQTWQIEASRRQEIEVRYDIHVNTRDELRLVTNGLSDAGGFFHGATLFLYPQGELHRPATLELAFPDNWRIVTPLRREGETTFGAESYHELAMAVAQFGEITGRTLQAGSIPVRLVFDSPLPPYDEAAFDERLRKVFQSLLDLFQGAPFRDYTVFIHWRPDLDYGGGVARQNSIVINIGKEWIDDLPANFVGTFTHELFHAWNARTFYPLGSLEHGYAAENYSRWIWLIEGLDNYYVYRTFQKVFGLSEKRFLAILAQDMSNFENSPGRGWLSLSEAEFPSWINAVEWLDFRSGGAVAAFLLDLEIQAATSGRRSLDNVLRKLYRESQQDGYRGFTEEDFVGILNTIADVELGTAFDRIVNAREALDYHSFLDKVGLSTTVTIEDQGQKSFSLERSASLTEEQESLLNRFFLVEK